MHIRHAHIANSNLKLNLVILHGQVCQLLIEYHRNISYLPDYLSVWGTENMNYYFLVAAFNTTVLSVPNFRLSRILLLYCFTPGINFCPESFRGRKTLLSHSETAESV